MVLLKEDAPGKERLDTLGEQTPELMTTTFRKRSEVFILAIVRSGYADLDPQVADYSFIPKSLRLSLANFYDKMLKNNGDDSNKKPAEVPPDNEFEERIRPQVICRGTTGVTFNDIGGLNEAKGSLKQLLILPLERPDCFKGALSKPCEGILLFGPPGAGKTMLAKAIATEAKARFIYCSMSTITSKGSGEVANNVKALFSVAAKVAPTIIFVDDVDSMLAKRENGDSPFMCILKNEFMSNWEGFMTKPGEQIIVLGATSRPFDLDEGVIRRFKHRVMVGLPSAEGREEILTIILSKEKTEGIDFRKVARMTGGYTGSDLENLCTTAVRRRDCEIVLNDSEEQTIIVRPLTMEDMMEAKKLVAPSFPAEGTLMNGLNEWNEEYGEGGSRKKKQPTYYN